MKVLAVADSDSYLKWAAALLDRLDPSFDRELVVVQTPVQPSAGQIRSALAGTRFDAADVGLLSLTQLAARVGRDEPEVVVLAVRGPVVRVLIRAIRARSAAHPVIVSGFPGISIPVALKAIVYREMVDLVIVHSHRELREFTAMAMSHGYAQRFALARFPFLPTEPVVSDREGGLVFATQAKVPYTRDDRLMLLGWLAEAARRRPEREVVIKVRTQAGETQTHPEKWDFAELLGELADPPPNLTVRAGSMAEHLDHARGLVTISSTAVLEAVARRVPVVVIGDFGVNSTMINSVYRDSGLIGSSADLVEGRFHTPNPGWLRENYLHDEAEADWQEQLALVLGLRAGNELPWRQERRQRLGGALRRAWDRKQTLGQFDRSITGVFALVVGIPLRAVVRRVRAVRYRRLRARAGRRGAAGV